MNVLAKVSALFGLGMFFMFVSPAQSASLFNVTSNGNYLTISTPSTKPLNVGIKSPGFNFSNCTQDAASGYCRFSLTNTQSQNLLIAGPAIQPDLTICSFGTNNKPTSCQTTQLAERFAYVVNYMGFSVSLCPVDSETGNVGTCTATMTDPSFLAVQGIAINPAGTVAYVTTSPYNGGGPNSISLCPINLDGTFGQCTTSAGYFKAPWYLALNATGSMAYVANAFNSPPVNNVSVCSLNPADGSFINCNNVADASFNAPAGVVLNNAGTRAYISNTGVGGNGVSVSLCPINRADGSLGTCQAMADPALHGPSGIVLNKYETMAYVTNYQIQQGNTIALCPVNTKNGVFKPCTTLSNPAFNGPIGIKLNGAGTFAYITENTTSKVTVCAIKSDGTFGTCLDSDAAPLNQPSDIVLF